MTKPHFQDSPVDHHIQAQILQQLFASDRPTTFSQLKPHDIENSLFMYHIRKLESRGVIKRDDNKGFRLTPNGARWVNFASPETLKPRMVPRLLLNFIITTPDGSKVLVSRRKSAVASYLTDYILPSGFHKYGLPMNQAAEKIIKSIAGCDVAVEYYDIYETIHKLSRGYVHHAFLPTFHGQMPEQLLPEQDHYESLWTPVSEIIANADSLYDSPLPEIIGRYAKGESFNHETFEIDTSSS